jgi:DNA-binding response OmpR family regulator
MEGKKVLIIEDDTFLQGLAANKIHAQGIEVNTASSGEEALTHVSNSLYDAILLDLMLPDISGFEILKNVRGREAFAKTPVLVFSNLSDDSDIQTALDLGATDYLVKANFTLDELVSKLQSALGGTK